MVFMIADDPEEPTEEVEAEEQDSAEDADQKAQLDEGEVSRAAQKVDLDLDDAPFLEDEDEEDEDEDEDEFEAPALEEKPERKPMPAWLRSKMMLLGIVLIVLLLAGIAVKLFFFSGPSAPPQKAEKVVEQPQELPEPEPEPEPPPPPPAAEGETVIQMDPFWVEQKNTKKQIVFLVASFSLTTTNDRLVMEFNRKILLLRDAVYYYLKNKNLQFLSDKKNSDKLKQDILTVLNQYMSSGQFDNLLIENYLIK